jgi:hypothetical protein
MPCQVIRWENDDGDAKYLYVSRCGILPACSQTVLIPEEKKDPFGINYHF